MKNKFNLSILVILLAFSFIVFYKGLDNSNTYTPKINYKKNIPVFKAKDFNSNIYIDSKKILHIYVLCSLVRNDFCKNPSHTVSGHEHQTVHLS